jgi:hypothetical protein
MVAYCIIAFGILLRLWQYGVNRSLWTDEAALALNIVERSLPQLLQPLSYDQAAPLGFLWMEKLAVMLFGNTEYALRLFPLLAGIAAIFLFYQLAKQYLSPAATLFALILFCSARDLIYYTSEVKQYSSDVAIALLCFFLVQPLTKPSLSRCKVGCMAIGGAILIWFSHPAIFTLFGVGVVVLVFRRLTTPLRSSWRSVLLIFTLWLLSFAGVYWLSLGNIRSSEYLQNYWIDRGAFPTELWDVNWLIHSTFDFFKKPLGFAMPFDAIALGCFVLGSIHLFRRNKWQVPLLLSPAIATLAAAYLQKYPFHSRLILFLTPFIFLLVGQGIASLWHWQFVTSERAARQLTVRSVVFLLIFSLISVPVFDAGSLLVKPRLKEEIKPVLNYIRQHRQAQDKLYVFQRGIRTFQYYAPKYGYQPEDYIVGVDDLDAQDGDTLTDAERQRYRTDLNQLRGHPRVWILSSHVRLKAERQFIRKTLNSMGKKLDAFESRDAYVDLYDLRS